MGHRIKERAWSSRWKILGTSAAVIVLLARTGDRMVHQSLWLDEAYTRAAVDNLWSSLTSTPGTMPLYYGCMALWGTVSTAPCWLRLPSLLASVATLVVVGGIASKVLGRRAAPLVPVVLVVSPMYAAKAIEARPYAFETLMVAAAWYLLVTWADGTTAWSGARRTRTMFLLLVVIGPAVHGLFVIQVAPMVAAAFLLPDRQHRRKSVVEGGLACLVVTLALVWLGRSHSIGIANRMSLRVALVDGFLDGRSGLALLVLVGAGVGILWSIQRWLRRGDPIPIVPILWVGLPLITFLLMRSRMGLFSPRYLAPASPGIALLVTAGGVACWQFVSRGQGRGERAPRVAMVAAILGIGLVAGTAPWMRFAPITGWDDVAATIATAARPGDAIVFVRDPVTGDDIRAPFEAAWSQLSRRPELVVLSPARPLGEVRRYDAVEPDPTIVDGAVAHRRLWIVSEREAGEIALVQRRDFGSDFSLHESWRFAGDVHVFLYLRQAR